MSELRRRTVSQRSTLLRSHVVIGAVPLDAAEWVWVDDETWTRWHDALRVAAEAQAEMDAAYAAARERRARLDAEGRGWAIGQSPEMVP